MAANSTGTKKIFEPDTTEELLRGWLLHSHKGRQRHDRAARRLDGRRRWLGGIATAFSAIVATSVFTALEEGMPGNRWKVLIAMISIVSAIFTGLNTFLNLAERADKHRTAAARYKAMIRELERRLKDMTDSSLTIESSVQEDIEMRLNELEENSPIVPEGIYLMVDQEWNTQGVEIITKAMDFYKPNNPV